MFVPVERSSGCLLTPEMDPNDWQWVERGGWEGETESKSNDVMIEEKARVAAWESAVQRSQGELQEEERGGDVQSHSSERTKNTSYYYSVMLFLP